MSRLRNNILPLFVLCFVSLAALWEVVNKAGVMGRVWDWGASPYMDGQRKLTSSSFYVWQEFFFGGRESPFNSLIFFQLIADFIDSLSSPTLGPKLLMVGLLAASGISFFFLLRHLGVGVWAAVLFSLPYMFNPRIMSMFIGGHLFQVYVFPVFPLVWLYLSRLESDEKIGHLIWLMLALFFTSLLTNNLVLIAFLAVPYSLVIIFRSRNKLRLTGKFASAGGFFIFLNLFWLLPFVMALRNPDYQVHTGYSLDEELKFRLMSLADRSWELWDLFGLSNLTSMATEHANHYGDGALEEIHRWVSLLSLVVIVLFVFVWRKRRLRLIEAVTLGMLAFSFLFITGTKTPFGVWFFQWFSANFGLIFSSFSNVWRFSPLMFFSWALMLALSSKELWDIGSKSRIVLVGFWLVLVCTHLYPWFGVDLTQPLITRGSQSMSLQVNRVDPSDLMIYEQMRRDEMDYRIMLVPSPGSVWPGHSKTGLPWGYTSFSKNLIFEWYGANEFYNDALKALYVEDSKADITQNLLQAGVKYVVYPRIESQYEPYLNVNPGKTVNYKQVEEDNMAYFIEAGQLIPEESLSTPDVRVYGVHEFLPHFYSPGASLERKGR
ncbi:MAG: hypothetical protein RRB13_02975 [bacterium]|nr:hypothetical protein [bacterium]